MMSPVFYMFIDRERGFNIMEAITGARMHPSWFRIGGVAQDLPEGWETLISDFVTYLPKRLDEYQKVVLGNSLFKARTRGIGKLSLDEAIEWGATRPHAARQRVGMGLPQKTSLQRLRAVRIRHPDGQQWRLL